MLTMYQNAQSLIAPIRVVSIGRLAHQALCGDALRARAAAAVDAVRRAPPKASVLERYARVMHASGLCGAVGLRVATRPATLPLDLLVGTGRHRYTLPNRAAGQPHVSYIEAFIDHPLDTGLLGLVSAYHLVKHAMIAGTLGAALGAVVGVVLWPMRGWPEAKPIGPFVHSWVQRGAFFSGCFGALMGSCFIMAPHNYIAMQVLRVLTAAPKAVAFLVGYGAGAVLGVGAQLGCDAVTGACTGAQWLWRGLAGSQAPHPTLQAEAIA